jgi:hypothetical protein
MKKTSACRFLGALFLGFILSFVSAASAANTLNYQGRVISGGTAFTGAGQFKFALVSADGTTVYWKNDGTTDSAAPLTVVPLAVTKGIFSVRLGDTSFSNMAAISSAVFSNTSMALRIWFNDGVKGFEQLSPDQTVSESALATVRNSPSSTGTGTVSAATVQEELFMLRLQTGAYPSTISGITMGDYVWDAFTSEVGINSSVSTHSENSYSGGYVCASSNGFSYPAIETSGSNNPISAFRTINIGNRYVSSVAADVNYGYYGPGFTRLYFYYYDGSSSYYDQTNGLPSSISYGTNWISTNFINPSPEKAVSAIAFTYLYNWYIPPLAPGTQWNPPTQQTRGVVIVVKQETEIVVAIPPGNVPSSFTKFKVLTTGTRVSGDNISYSISDGVNQTTDLVLGTQYTWTGSGIPSLLKFKLTPAEQASPTATKISSYALFFN